MKTIAIVLVSLFMMGHAIAAETPAEQWAKMPPEKKEEVRNNYREYQKLSREEKQKLDQRYEQYKTLPPEEKVRLQKNYEAFKKLPKDKQEKILKSAEKYRSAGTSLKKPKNRKHSKKRQ